MRLSDRVLCPPPVRGTLQMKGGPMDDKTLNALPTTLALFQIRRNALMLLVDRHVSAGAVRDDHEAGRWGKGMGSAGSGFV